MGKKIVILGAGYAGIQAAKHLAKHNHGESAQVSIIDKNAYHTLLTELHEAAAGRVKPQAVQIPLAEVFRKDELDVVQDTISHIDFEQKTLQGDRGSYSFDYLVISSGSRPAFFNIPGAERYGFKLWSYKEAVLLREHINDCFIRAAASDSAVERKKLLSFIIAGGGFTGVEMAGELAEWRDHLCKQYKLDKAEVSITLVEAMHEILGVLDPSVVKKVRNRMEKMGIRILTDAAITSVEFNKVLLGDTALEGTLVWTAGIQGAPYLQNMDIKLDRRFRVDANEYLQSTQHDFVFCAGDIISGSTYPQVVETALQSGEQVAYNINALLKDKPMAPFKPKYHGTVVSVGFWYAGAKVNGMRFTGLIGTAAKQFTNIHYMWMIGKVHLTWRYILYHFIYKYVFSILQIDHKDNVKKNVTQDVSFE